MKFQKASKQLGAYSLGIKQTLGMTVQQGAIIVATQERTQLFVLSRRYLDIMEEKWLKIVEEYYTQKQEHNDCDPDLI
jgi:hypothetical protein